MQERLNGELTQPLSRSSLKALITKVPLATAATFGKVGAKTYTKAEGSKTTEGTQKGPNKALLHPSRSAEAGFLALTHLPPNAHAGTSAGHR